MHGLFDLLGDVTGQAGGGQVVDVLGLYNNAHFASGLDGKGLRHTIEGLRELFKGTDALDVGFDVFAAGTGTGAGNGIGGLSDDGFDTVLIFFMVMRFNGVDHDRVDAIAPAIFRTQLGVGAFLVGVHGFADIVQETALL